MIFLKFLLIIPISSFLRTRKFFWHPTRGNNIYERICTIWDVKNNEKKIVNYFKELIKIERNSNSSIPVLMEAYSRKKDMMCVFIGSEDSNNLTIYTASEINNSQILPEAYKEIKELYSYVDCTYIIDQKWFLEYMYEYV